MGINQFDIYPLSFSLSFSMNIDTYTKMYPIKFKFSSAVLSSGVYRDRKYENVHIVRSQEFLPSITYIPTGKYIQQFSFMHICVEY
jgi:hypothetical protein